MPRISIAILFCLAPVLASAQQLMFRYIDKDGRVVYTDMAPPPDAKSVQQKKLGGNFIETSEAPYALQVAQQRNPVTLYSGACGALCDQARALLNRRGIPYRDIDPSQPGELQKMKQVTGDQQVPVLVAGSAIVLKGFEEEKWQAALDQAGYPKTPQARITALKREADKAAADKATDKSAGKADTKVAVKDDAKGEARPDAKDDAKGEARPDAKPDPAPETRK
jgi:glutaredoxin